MELEATTDKRVITQPVKTLLRQGESGVDEITIRIPYQFYGNMDLREFTFRVHSVNMDHDDAIPDYILEKTVRDGAIDLKWKVFAEYTKNPGRVTFEIIGSRNGIDIIKYIGDDFYIRPAAQGYAREQAAMEDFLNQIAAQLEDYVTRAREQADRAEAEADRLYTFGVDFRIYDFFPTLEVLKQKISNPKKGDAYGVGNDPVFVYIWNGAEWKKGQALDVRMEEITPNLIYPYTHAREGTVHALTGPTGAGYLAFTATADFVEGDSFTLNGTSVTAQTVDGSALQSGDFAVGQCVIAAAGEGKLTFPWRGYGERLRKVEAFTLDAPPETHRTTFRGKNLGTEVTAEQKAHIQDGTFRDLYLGDYWEIGGHTWRIVDIDYWMNCGDTAFTKHHLVIMPDKTLYSAQMNATDTTEGGYIGSDMYKTNLKNAKSIISSSFGGAVLTHREYLVNAVTNGYPSAGAWYDSSVELPNEIMMYGSLIFTPAGNGSIVVNRHTTSNSQLALMAACSRFIKTREVYWLRDIVSAVFFVRADYEGTTNSLGASYSLGVRPVFPIG